jgi:hypothetical protein
LKACAGPRERCRMLLSRYGKDGRSWIMGAMDFEEAWARFMLAEQRSLRNRAEGILASALAKALPEESQEELERWVEEDQRLAREGLVELMNEHGEIYHLHIEELRPEDVVNRLRAETARSDWLGWRRDQRIEWVEVWRNLSRRRRD